jgi:hypothetical protein
MKAITTHITDSAADESILECCTIAESIIDEIEAMAKREGINRLPSDDGRLKGSLRRKLFRRIRSVRDVAI